MSCFFVVDIVSANMTGDRGFKSRQGARFLGPYIAVLFVTYVIRVVFVST
jgi:hypothetical protein